MLKTLLNFLQLPWLQVLQLLSVLLLIYAVDNPRKFLLNLVKFARAIQRADPEKFLDAVTAELEEPK